MVILWQARPGQFMPIDSELQHTLHTFQLLTMYFKVLGPCKGVDKVDAGTFDKAQKVWNHGSYSSMLKPRPAGVPISISNLECVPACLVRTLKAY